MYKEIKEESLKLKVSRDYFGKFDCTDILGNIDFSVKLKSKKSEDVSENKYLLWAESKSKKSNNLESLVQLILTIGKARTFDNFLPPYYLGSFDYEKIIFIPYSDIHDIFYINDFNWNVTPSNHTTKEFKLLSNKLNEIIEKNSLIYYFLKDDVELKEFISSNFTLDLHELSKTRIDKNNFVVIYNKWLKTVKDTISVNWDIVKKNGIIDGDFYLADLLSSNNETIKDKLYVILKNDHYEIDKVIDDSGMFTSKSSYFNDRQQAHSSFWNRYERPPKEEYWDYIIERRDLLVPQDIRERKGSFFTPQKWVELSQFYMKKNFGIDWQEEYYIWDCAAGTGNLLTGLTNKYNVWASTIDKQDVDIMKDRVKNGANLLESHIFQFDYLNDDFSAVPKSLLEIINDEEKRKKLIVYINPPYAEVSSIGSKGKSGVNKSKAHDKYSSLLGSASREIFTFFFIRSFFELKGCKICEFSTLKILQGSAFESFREVFKSKILDCFIVPANSFDNVKGSFPIGFKIWDTDKEEIFNFIDSDVYDYDANFIDKKKFNTYDKKPLINKWISKYKAESENLIGFLAGTNGNDFQQNKIVYILNTREQMANPRGIWITDQNLLECCMYFACRKCFEITWINYYDQFFYPLDSWESDTEFLTDCLIFTLFHEKNLISKRFGINHWIPYSSVEVGSKDNFESNLMHEILLGNISIISSDMFNKKLKKLKFSKESKKVVSNGNKLWSYYHSMNDSEVNASFYDIKEYFQKRNTSGKMNSRSEDDVYTMILEELKKSLNSLKEKIRPLVYKHKFLM